MRAFLIRAAVGLMAMWVLLIAAARLSAWGTPDGGWYYHSDPSGGRFGTIQVYSDYQDSRGIPWSEK